MPRETLHIRVAFVDVDSSQRIHFTAMFRYFEVAEHALMRAIGMPYAGVLLEYRFPRVHLDCDLRAAVVYDDELDVEACVQRVGTSSWTVRFEARKAPDGMLAAKGHMTIVAMDPETERATPLPEALRRALTDAGDQ
jgi:YbgC/YbaW family acyl-CoA thioester hydrolase